MLVGLAEWIADVVHQLGYAGLAALIAAENLFPPLPSELVLPLAGFLVAEGRMHYPLAVAAATAGSLFGALALYGLGALIGERRLRAVVRRTPLLEEADVDRGHAWFARHGGRAVLIGRVIPIVRSVISIPAGIERMPLGRFTAYTVVGSSIWNAALIGAGWLLGEQWELLRPWISRFEIAILVLAAGALVLLAVRRWNRVRPPSA